MAETTEKYGLRTPSQNDFFDVKDVSENMEKLENALTEFDDSGTVEDIKSFPDFLTKLVTGNKLAVTIRNLKAGLQFVLHAGQIVNNCVTDNAGLPLSAAQGKALMDKYTQLYSDKADVSALNSYATKSELTASKNGYPGVKTIKSLSSAGQLTQAGSYHFEAITADVNKDAGTEIFSEYNMGDFYALLLGEDSNSNDGCNFGTLLIASPRINNGIWICTIWQKKMIHWYKIAKISTD